MLLAYLFIFLAAIFKSLMDKSAENQFKRVWLNKDLGFGNDENKWLYEQSRFLGQVSWRVVKQKRSKWLYLGFFIPKHQEKFFLSSTLLVFLTDGWHLFQFFMLLCIKLAIISPFILVYFKLYNYILPPTIFCGWVSLIEIFLHLSFILGTAFEISYSLILPKLLKKTL